MPYYPILVDLRGKKVIVVGGGDVGQRKIETLLEYEAKVCVVSRELTPRLSRYVDEKEIRYLGGDFKKEHLEGAILVIAATDDPLLNQQVSTWAKEKGILVNAVDRPADCTFIVPSILKRGDLLIAVSTAGKSPALSKKIREDLESLFGLEYETFLVLLGRLRQEILQKGFSQEENRSIFKRLVNSPILEMIRGEDWDGIALSVSDILLQPVSREKILAYLREE